VKELPPCTRNAEEGLYLTLSCQKFAQLEAQIRTLTQQVFGKQINAQLSKPAYSEGIFIFGKSLPGSSLFPETSVRLSEKTALSVRTRNWYSGTPHLLFPLY
jgi:hypothetical protein